MKKSLLPLPAERFCTWAFGLLCLVLFAFLFGSSFVSSWMNQELYNEYVYFQWDSLPGNLVFLLVAAAASALLTRLLANRTSASGRDRLALVLAVLAVCIGIAWVQLSATSPQADQLFITEQAGRFNDGNFTGFEPGGYAAIYQHQLGIITVLRLLGWVAPLFHTQGWHLFQLFSALTTGLLVYAGYRVTGLLTARRPMAELFYLALAFFCAPMYIYDAFVYGESSSTAFVMLAAWMFLQSLHSPAIRYRVGLYLAAAAALILRTNTVIVFIAFAIVLVIRLLREPSLDRLFVAVALVLALLTPTALTAALYADKIPAESKPLPAMLFIAMGIKDDATNAGWYNGYNTRQYENFGYDPQAASEKGKTDVLAFLNHCREDPAYGLDFYNRKISSQWNAPMYQCIVMNNHIEGEQPAWIRSLYEGTGNRLLTAYMNGYQLLVYGGVLAFALLALKKRPPLEGYLLLIAVFGGFLFSALWEGKARYVFPYFLMMLPYAAAGIAAVGGAIRPRQKTQAA